MLLILLFSIESLTSQDKSSENPIKSKMNIKVKLFINKIYNIDALNESFSIDGYLVMSWITNTNNFKEPFVMYENDLMDDFISINKFRFPLVEFINTLGAREISNKRLIIKPKGRIIYNERFNAVFHNTMDFKKFPFDIQSFNVQLEAFSYDKTELEFIKDAEVAEIDSKSSLIGWEILSEEADIYDIKYEHLVELSGYAQKFSRIEYKIIARRLPGYYIWQVLFPLLLIIVSSWVIFWLKNFSDQIATSFTLMLTVVAFNFYSATFLPQLPYNTFIESLIMSGYIFIFVVIITNVFFRFLGDRYPQKIKLSLALRFIYPVTSLVVLFMVVLSFFNLHLN